MPALMPVEVRLKRSTGRFRPPATNASPRMSSRLPMMLPVIDAFTTLMYVATFAGSAMTCAAARRPMMAMMSSAALPNVALSRPPMVGPVRAATCSVASPMRLASGSTATHATANTSSGEAWKYPSAMLAGTANSRIVRHSGGFGLGASFPSDGTRSARDGSGSGSRRGTVSPARAPAAPWTRAARAPPDSRAASAPSGAVPARPSPAAPAPSAVAAAAPASATRPVRPRARARPPGVRRGAGSRRAHSPAGFLARTAPCPARLADRPPQQEAATRHSPRRPRPAALQQAPGMRGERQRAIRRVVAAGAHLLRAALQPLLHLRAVDAQPLQDLPASGSCVARPAARARTRRLRARAAPLPVVPARAPGGRSRASVVPSCQPHRQVGSAHAVGVSE